MPKFTVWKTLALEVRQVMATWHQERGGLLGVWQPDPTRWKVVCDRLHQAANVGYFDTRDTAEKNAKATGGVVILPVAYNAEAAQ